MADDLLAGLRKQSKTWASFITREATKNLGRFASLIKVSSKTVENSGKLEITSTGASKNKKKSVARAYEYGSGTRSRSTKTSRFQQGSKGFIRIAPKRKKVLAFAWDKVSADTPAGKKFLGVSKKTGKALFAFVDHPGVVAANSGKGYLAPAIAKVRKTIRKEIPVEVRKAAIGTFRKAFGTKG